MTSVQNALNTPLCHSASECLRSQKGKIMRLWEERVRAEVPAARHQARQALMDHLPDRIENLADTFSRNHRLFVIEHREDKKDEERKDLAKKTGEQRANLKNYSLDQVIHEYQLFRKVLFEVLEENIPLDHQTTQLINDAVDRDIGSASAAFVQQANAERERLIHHLSTQSLVAQILASQHDLSTALLKILEVVCNERNWALGAVWYIDPSQQHLRCIQTWSTPGQPAREFIDATQRLTFQKGEGLPGRVWKSAQPLSLDNVRKMTGFKRAALAIKEGIQGAIACPISVQNEVRGVLELYARQERPPDQWQLDLMCSIGNQLGQFIERNQHEESLKKSEERFRTMANAIPQLAWIADARGWVYWYNSRWFEYTGTAFQDVQGFGWKQVIHPDHLKRVMAKLTNAMRSGEPWEDTFPLRSKSGDWRWFLSRATPIRDEHGKAEMWIGTLTDITESLFAQETIEREKALLHAVLEQMPAAVWIIEAPSGKVIMSNTRAVTALKQPNRIPTVIENYSQYETYHLDGRPYQPFEFPAARAIRRGETITDEEMVFVRPDKSRTYVQVSAAPVRDHENRVIAAVAVALDISKTKRVEEALKLNQEHLQKLLAVADAALTQDVTIEGSYCDLLTRVKDAFSADSAAILLVSEDGNTLEICAAVGGMEEDVKKKIVVPVGRGIAGKIYASGNPLRISDVSNMEVISPFLHEKTKSVIGVPLRTESGPLGVIHVGTSEIREFTEDDIRMLQVIADRIAIAIEYAKLYDRSLKNLDELQKGEKLREQFVVTLSHDLRNPLTAAKTSAELLLHFPNRPIDREQLLRNIILALNRADRMIVDLLDANRIKAGKQIPIQFFKSDLTAVVRGTLEELSMTYGNRFVLRAPKHLHGIWAGDAIRRVVENLCNNAVKYGAKDKKVTVDLTPEKERLLLSVHNFGQAIPKEQQARLFQPFQRTHAAVMSGKHGWGLGLALVRGIAEAHGGSVTVHSANETGTTFTVSLPWSASA